MNYLCALCGVDKQNKLELERHIRTVHDERDSKCDPCGKTFEGRKSFYNHNRIHKSNESEIEEFQCDECTAVFKYNYNLNKHKLLHKPVEDKFKCDKCTYVSPVLFNLKRHKVKCQEKSMQNNTYECIVLKKK